MALQCYTRSPEIKAETRKLRVKPEELVTSISIRNVHVPVTQEIQHKITKSKTRYLSRFCNSKVTDKK